MILVGYDLGVHLGCVALDVAPGGAVALVARRTIQVGAIEVLDPPRERRRKDGSTWIQTTRRERGPAATARAAREAVAWAMDIGARVAAIEWIRDLLPGSHSPVLYAGQLGQSLHDALVGAGLPVALYVRSTALALVRRLAASVGAPLLPGTVGSRGAELRPVLAALVVGWAASGPRPCVPTGAGPDGREDRRPEHEGDACAVALAHVAALAGLVVVRAPRAARDRAPRVACAGRPGRASASKPAEGCRGCARGVIDGPTHRRACPRWRRVSGLP